MELLGDTKHRNYMDGKRNTKQNIAAYTNSLTQSCLIIYGSLFT